MKHEPISQLCFVEQFGVQGTHTARALFEGLPFAGGYARRLPEVLASAALLAQLESICIAALEPHIDWPQERVLGRAMRMEHCGAARVDEVVQVSGFVSSLGDRSVQFHVEARVGTRTVARGTLSFAVVEATRSVCAPAAALVLA